MEVGCLLEEELRGKLCNVAVTCQVSIIIDVFYHSSINEREVKCLKTKAPF